MHRGCFTGHLRLLLVVLSTNLMQRIGGMYITGMYGMV